MADPRFFTNRGPFSLQQIANYCEAHLDDPLQAGLEISDVAPLETARKDCLSFLDNKKYKSQFTESSAGACILHEDMKSIAPNDSALLVSPSPYKSYALAAQLFYPPEQSTGTISVSAIVDPTAELGENIDVGPNAIIESGVKIGNGTIISAGAVLGKNIEIGSGCWIGANATLTHCLIGDHVRIYSGVRIGQDGFGFAMDDAAFVKVPQLGRVIIEDDVEIGANTTIDRGSGPDTFIGQGTWIDNQVQIGHNVKIGKRCILIAQSGIAGSTTLKDYVIVAAQSGVAGHLQVGMGAKIGAKSGVMRDVAAQSDMFGIPAAPVKEYMRQVAFLKKAVKKKK